MPDAQLSIIDEVETTISIGSAEKRLETIKRVTDLFLSSAGSFNHEQIELFGDLLERLIKTIEIRAIADVSARIALAEMSIQLAPVGHAHSSPVPKRQSAARQQSRSAVFRSRICHCRGAG